MPSSTVYNLLQARRQTGCPGCRVKQGAVERHSSSLLHESVNDIQVRERLRDELAEFIRKNDYRFRDEGIGSEGDAWRPAIGKVMRNI